MSERDPARSEDAYAVGEDAYALDQGPARSAAQGVLARSLRDPRGLVRKLVIGEAIGERRRRVLGLKRPARTGEE